MFSKSSDNLTKIVLKFFFIFVFFLISPYSNATEKKNAWEKETSKVYGQTIFFHAWGGAKNINSYIKWASDEVKKRYNITVKHVKVSDTANVVARILSEKNVKKDNNGAVDLVWINGENFSVRRKIICFLLEIGSQACQIQSI